MSRKNRPPIVSATPHAPTSARAIDPSPAGSGATVARQEEAFVPLSDAEVTRIMRNQDSGRWRWLQCPECERLRHAGTLVRGACSSCGGHGYVRLGPDQRRRP